MTIYKKARLFSLSSFVFVIALGLMTSANATMVYDANAAFVANELGAEANPFGPFSVGYSTTLGGFTPFAAPAQHTNNFFNPFVQGFYFNNSASVPAAVVNTDTANQQTTSFGSTLDPSQILLHPGGIGSDSFAPPIYNAVLRFTAPSTGSYTIVGDWESLHPGITNNLVLHNGGTIFSSIADNSSFNLMRMLVTGDTIDFVVDDYDGINSDSTGLRAVLTADVPEPATLALMGLGLAGIGYRRHRIKKVA